MSRIAAESLFSTQGAVLKDPAEVERALAEMWEPAGQTAGGEQGARTATRISVANLIVVAGDSEWNELAETLAELSPMVPARMIVLLISEGAAEPAEIRASVSALCHVPEEGEAQVCCEQIVLRAGSQHVDVLDETLLPLLESDVPVMGWWRLDPGRRAGLFAAVRSLADRLVVDAGLAGFGHLEPAGRCAVREVGWYRTYPWREQIARMFDGCGVGAVEGIEQVSVEMRSSSMDEQVDASWLIGFLAGQLGWEPVRVGNVEGGVQTGNGRRRAALVFRSERREVQVDLVENAGQGCGLRALKLTSRTGMFEAQGYASRPDEYRIVVCDHNVCQMPRSVQVPPIRPSQALAAALAGRRVDAAFDRARPVATWVGSRLFSGADRPDKVRI